MDLPAPNKRGNLVTCATQLETFRAERFPSVRYQRSNSCDFLIPLNENDQATVNAKRSIRECGLKSLVVVFFHSQTDDSKAIPFRHQLVKLGLINCERSADLSYSLPR